MRLSRHFIVTPFLAGPRRFSLACLAVLLLMSFIFYVIQKLYILTHEKSAIELQLRNVNYMLDMEKELFDAHVDPSHFTAALQKVADFLNAEHTFLWLPDAQPDVTWGPQI